MLSLGKKKSKKMAKKVQQPPSGDTTKKVAATSNASTIDVEDEGDLQQKFQARMKSFQGEYLVNKSVKC